MITEVKVTASAQRLARWKRVALKCCLIQLLAVIAPMPLVLAATSLSVQSAQAATVTQSPHSPRLMWVTRTAVQLAWKYRARVPAKRELAYRWAQTQAGAHYKYGGQGDGGYDCSGLVRTAYRHAGIWLPRTTSEMLQYWRLDPEASPRQGDLVFFGTGHVELYAGSDRSFGAETNSTGTWWNRWWPSSWWPTAFYHVSGAG